MNFCILKPTLSSARWGALSLFALPLAAGKEGKPKVEISQKGDTFTLECKDKVKINYTVGEEETASSVLVKQNGSKEVNMGVASRQGTRDSMEDTHYASAGQNMQVYGVFDGHSGAWVAEELRRELPLRLLKIVQDSAINRRAASPGWEGRPLALLEEGIVQQCEDFDASYLLPLAKKKGRTAGGSTAVVALAGERVIVLVNTGDSRGIYFTREALLCETKDHKPGSPAEKSRLAKAGATLTHHPGGVVRVHGYSLSRAFGDFSGGKKLRGGAYCPRTLLATPQVSVVPRSSAPGYIVLASDGLWDVMSSRQVMEYILDSSAPDLSTLCNDLVRHAYALGSTDNITVVIAEVRGV